MEWFEIVVITMLYLTLFMCFLMFMLVKNYSYALQSYQQDSLGTMLIISILWPIAIPGLLIKNLSNSDSFFE